MNNNLVFYVYRLTFQSGNSYVGFHKQKKLNDNYITSSSYYHNHPEDKLISRDILFQTDDEFEASFIETWCILSDKAYNPKTNVNYNLGNFFHRFSTGFRTPDEKQASINKKRLTMSKKTSEELKAIIEKQKHTMSLKSAEELADIHKRQGVSGKRPKSEETKKRMSESGKRRCAQMNTEQKEHFRKALSQSKQGTKLSEEHKMSLSITIKSQYENDKELSEKRINGLKKANKLKRKKIMCIETKDVFESVLDAAKWIGPKARGCNISAQARGRLHFAYHHPMTGEPLHWKFISDNN